MWVNCDPKLIPVIIESFSSEEEGIERIFFLFLSEHLLELGAILGRVFDELIDAFLKLRVRGGRGDRRGWIPWVEEALHWVWVWERDRVWERVWNLVGNLVLRDLVWGDLVLWNLREWR